MCLFIVSMVGGSVPNGWFVPTIPIPSQNPPVPQNKAISSPPIVHVGMYKLKAKPDDCKSAKRISPWCAHTLYYNDDRGGWFCPKCQHLYDIKTFTEQQARSWESANPMDTVK